MSRSPVNLPRQFEVSSPSASSLKRAVVEDPTFASALASQSPVENPGKVGKIGELRRSFKWGCCNRNFFVWAWITAALLVICYHLSCCMKLLFMFFIVFVVYI